MTPTARSKAKLEKDGWTADVVEKWIPVPSHPAKGIRRDLWGFGDILAIKAGEPPLIVQTTSAANMAARVTKIETECREKAELWLKVGGRIVVHGWRKGGKKGKRKLWLCNEQPVIDLPPAIHGDASCATTTQIDPEDSGTPGRASEAPIESGMVRALEGGALRHPKRPEEAAPCHFDL